MKIFNYLLVIILSSLLLFYVGCQDESSIVSTDNSFVSNEDPNWIQLPVTNDNQLQKVHSVKKLITVKRGGKISLKKKFKGGPHKTFEINAEIKFRPNVVTKDTKFTMALDDKTGMLTFSPAMTLNGNAQLSVSLKGINLDGLNAEEIDFVYCDSNGQFVEVDYKKLIVDVEDGILAVLKVEPPLLSRYGFTK